MSTKGAVSSQDSAVIEFPHVKLTTKLQTSVGDPVVAVSESIGLPGLALPR
jgi:hypothetical protein